MAEFGGGGGGGYRGGGGGGGDRGRDGGDRGNDRGGPRRSGPGGGAGGPGGPGGKKQYFRRKKVCKFCIEKIDDINYKDMKLVASFIAERGRIMPRRITGVCTPHQRRICDAIKKARNIALLPFAVD
jgi:small subunit ribosomal protein S18